MFNISTFPPWPKKNISSNHDFLQFSHRLKFNFAWLSSGYMVSVTFTPAQISFWLTFDFHVWLLRGYMVSVGKFPCGRYLLRICAWTINANEPINIWKRDHVRSDENYTLIVYLMKRFKGSMYLYWQNLNVFVCNLFVFAKPCACGCWYCIVL